MKERPVFAKVVFFFIAALPWLLFRAAYLVLTLGKRRARLRKYRAAPKHITLRRLSACRMKALEAFEGVRALNGTGTGSPPRLIELFERLWDEEMSDEWKIPLTSELRAVKASLLADIEHSPLTTIPRARLSIWAIDDHSRMFVGYCPFTDQSEEALPEFSLSFIHNHPPESKTAHFAFAVSVRMAGK